MGPVWSHAFEVVMRPLRVPNGPHAVVVVEARTAAQASRLALTLYPDRKVLSVHRRVTEPVALDVRAPPAAPAVEAAPPAAPRRRFG
jgi:hypothetical protein